MSRRYEWNQIHEILNDYSVQYITRSVSKRVRCENREYSVAVYLPKKTERADGSLRYRI